MYARATGLRGTGARSGASRRRKRTVNIAKVRYQAPTARHQKSQILANARLLASHSKMLRRHKVYTDWHDSGSLSITSSSTWGVVKLTDFQNWTSVLRQDPVVTEKSHTFVLRLQLNLRFLLNEADFAGISLFVVTPRKNAVGIDPFTNPPVKNVEWIEPSNNQGFNVRLNSGIYKVHYSKYLTLTSNTLLSAAVPAETVGNPNTTWRKSQVNVPLKMSVTQPALYGTAQGSWKLLGFDDLPYYSRFYIIAYMVFGGTGTATPAISYDSLITCVNTA